MLITFIDVVIHDTFVLNTYYCDDPKNANLEQCRPITATKTLSLNIENQVFQYEITGRQNYWLVLNVIIGFVALVPAIFRGYFLGNLKAGLMYFLSVLLPIIGGFEDFGYYELRGLSIPAEMPWLNANPFIAMFANGATVTATTLYLSMVAVMVILAIGWILALRKR